MQTTKTTIRLTLPARPRFDGLPLPLAIAVCIFALLGIAAAVGRITSAPSAAAVPTAPLPIIIVATRGPEVPLVAPAPAQQVAAAVPAGNVTRRAIVVYGSPDLSAAIGAVEPGRAFTPVAHYGSEWMQLDMQGSGLVFVRVADLYDLPPNLIDLKPAAPAQVIVQPVYVEQPAPPQAPAVEQPAYQVSNDQPPAPPEPERPAVALPAPAALPAQQEQPTQAPAPPAQPPSQPSDVERAWYQEQLRWEHPEWATPYPPGQ